MSKLEEPRTLSDGATSAKNAPTGSPKSSAIALVDEGNALEELGRTDEAMARYDAAVESDPRCARAHLNRGNVLLAGGGIEEARSAYQTALDCDPRYAAAHFNLGNLNCRVGQFESAVSNYRVAIDLKPEFASAFVAMGNAFDNLGRTSEARTSYEHALLINPHDAGIYFNLALLAIAEGRHEQAVESLSKAITIRPDYGAALCQLGRLLSTLGRLDTAEDVLRRARALEPDSEEITHDLALVLLARSKAPEAVELTLQQLERAPTWKIKMVFAGCAAQTRFLTTGPRIRAALTAAINAPWAAPYQLCWPALSVIMLDSKISACVRLLNERQSARGTDLFTPSLLETLGNDELLRALLQAVPVSSLEFVRLLTAARRALLDAAANGEHTEAAGAAFYGALAQQCFINEYIFDYDDDELTLAAACRERLLALLEAGARVPSLLLLAVAAYFPLYTLPEPSRLLRTSEMAAVNEVLRQQVREPLREQALRQSISSLTPITHGVSARVRDQYEQNPYPRWVKLPIFSATLHFNMELRRVLPLSQFTPLENDSQPEMLIAGCGTGSQSILDSQRFRGVRVLAVDLSLSSISYALRKTQELGITNIEYAQADILKLGDLAREFDVIASVGVLHHLADPFKGWRTLLSLLRPGGFMQLGFYSKLARRHVITARQFIATRGYASTPSDIRRLRRDLATGDSVEELRWLSNTQDFYSTSDCRDLLFHVQEHCLTLDQIESFLSECGLDFLGFELDARLLRQYRSRFPDDAAGTNLRNWLLFETENPDSFVGMYQFWIQKPTNR